MPLLLTVTHHLGRNSQNFEKPILSPVAFRYSMCSSFTLVKRRRFCCWVFIPSTRTEMYSFFPGHILENSSDWLKLITFWATSASSGFPLFWFGSARIPLLLFNSRALLTNLSDTSNFFIVSLIVELDGMRVSSLIFSCFVKCRFWILKMKSFPWNRYHNCCRIAHLYLTFPIRLLSNLATLPL